MQLNPAPQHYKEFHGRNTEQMPKLIAEGRVPLSVAGLMETRLKHGNELADWMDNYFDTGDAVIYHPNGRIKIAPDSEHLRQINPESRLLNGALVLDDGVYDSVSGQEFTKAEFEKYAGMGLSLKQVRSNPIWQALARDQNLLDEYSGFIFDQAKSRFNYDKNMGLYLDSASDVPKLRAWCVYGLDYWSGAVGWDFLDFVIGRFVGVSTGGADSAEKTA